MIRCPHCFTPAPLPRPPQPSPVARGRAVPPLPPTDGDRPTKCPTCERPYPPRWLDAGTTSIVMAGATGTGKSIYIAVMIKQLEQWAAARGMDLAPATPAVRRVFQEHYVNPLYVERGIMGNTPPSSTQDAYQRESLVFELIGRDDVRHHLIIRDVAGEDLEKADELAPGQLAFFGNADCVLFLVDPLKIDGVATSLRGLVPEQELGGDPKQVLAATLALVAHGTPRLGVIMSKFDVMQALRDVQGGGQWSAIMRNPGAAFFRDPGPFVLASEHDGTLLHHEVRSLLMRLDQRALVARLENAGRTGGYQFFAVSALGDTPRGDQLSTRGIAPFRCLDPVRWALAGSGFPT